MENRDRGRSGHGPGYAILALLCLLLVDLFGGSLPLPERAVMVLAAGLSALVVAGLLRGGHYFYVLLFGATFLNVLTDFRSLPDGVDTVADAAGGRDHTGRHPGRRSRVEKGPPGRPVLRRTTEPRATPWP